MPSGAGGDKPVSGAADSVVAVAKGVVEKHASPKLSICSDLSKRPPVSLRSRGWGQM